MRDLRAQKNGVTLFPRFAQALNRAEIEYGGRLREPQVQHGSQRLAACHRFGQLFACSKQPAGLGNAARPRILERSCFHVRALAAAIAASKRRGLTGLSVISTPMSFSASLIALTIAAGGAIAPPSPIPFWPNSV